MAGINAYSLRMAEPGSELTISSGAITPVASVHTVGAESVTTDDLDTINTSGFDQLSVNSITHRPRLILRAASGDTITVKHGTGNISLNGAADYALSGDKQVELSWNGTNWTDLAVPGSGGGGSSLPVDDTTALVQDPADNTKLMRIDVGGVTTATTRVATMPDADLTIVGTATAQILTNKTLDANNNTVTNIGSSEVETGLITGLTADASPDGAADYVMTYDTSGTALKKVLLDNLPSSGGGGFSGVADSYQADEGSDYTTTSTTFVDVDASNFSLTITTTGGNVLIGFYGVVKSGASQGVHFDVDIHGTRAGLDDGIIGIKSASVDDQMPVTFVHLETGLSAASHTFKLQWKRNGGTATLYAGAGTSTADYHPQFWVQELN